MNHEHADVPFEPELDPTVTAFFAEGPSPSPDLEERVVRALREHALLRPASVSPRQMARRRIGVAWLVGAAAAALAFATGLRVGGSAVRVGGSGAASTATPPINSDSGSVAAATRVQRAAFEYISALSAIRGSDTAARAASVATFHSVTGQIVRLAPEGDIAIAIRAGLPSSFAVSLAAAAAAAPSKHVIWF
jgi:hypothetical protein